MGIYLSRPLIPSHLPAYYYHRRRHVSQSVLLSKDTDAKYNHWWAGNKSFP